MSISGSENMVGRSGDFALSKEEFNRLLNTFDNIHEKAIIALATTTGIRRKDLVELKRNNYDSTTRKLTFYEHKKDSYHTIKIPSRHTVLLLNDHIVTSAPSEWLFPSPLSSACHVSVRHVYNLFIKHLGMAGLQERPFHSLRATFLQLCESGGVDFRITTRIMNIKGDTACGNYHKKGWRPTPKEMQELAINKPLLTGILTEKEIEMIKLMEVAEKHYDAPSVGEIKDAAKKMPFL